MPVVLETVVDTSEQDIGFRGAVAVDLREQIHAAGVQATREVFEQQVLPAAQAGSPVGTPPDDKHPGKNRDSIAVSFRDRLESGWISAWLFTQSGYGWLIEHGTSHNRELTKTPKRRRQGRIAVADRTPAHPYLFPAMRFCEGIAERQREILEEEQD